MYKTHRAVNNFPFSQDVVGLPEGASTPALGLSNKAVFQGTHLLYLVGQLC